MWFVRSLWDKELRQFVVFSALFSLFSVGLGLATGSGAASWLPVPLGLWGGFFAVCAAFRHLRWSESTAKIISATSVVVVVAMWLVQYLLLSAIFPSSSTTPAGSAYQTAWLFLIGFGAPAPAVARQRFDQPDHR